MTLGVRGNPEKNKARRSNTSFPRTRESREKQSTPMLGGFTFGVVSLSYVYILANKRNGTLYVGVTSDLVQRVWEHKNDFVEGFTKLYGVHTLVWYEEHGGIEDAIQREKNIKRWRREWKLDLIERMNPSWRDLYEDIL